MTVTVNGEPAEAAAFSSASAVSHASSSARVR